MYKCINRYRHIEEGQINAELIIFSADSINTPELWLKSLFLLNMGQADHLINCYILNTTTNEKFRLIGENYVQDPKSSLSLIEKPILLSPDEQIIYKGDAVNLEISCCLTYDAGEV